MNFSPILLAGVEQMLALFLLLAVMARPVGIYIARIFEGEPTFLSGVIGPLERGILRCCGPQTQAEMNWKTYATSLLCFSIGGFLLLSLLLFNAPAFTRLSPELVFSIAVSYLTNTNFQTYSPELVTGAFTQMAGLAVQNFLSAGVGLCVFAALARGFSRTKAQEIGNFWTDLTRAILYLLLPLSVLFAILFLSQGVVQTFGETLTLSMLDSQAQQTLMTGPVASQAAIKLLGSNGGGYFMANAAHPFENPTPLSNFIGCFAVFLLPVSLPFAFGRMVRAPKQGRSLLAVMLLLFIPLMLFCVVTEQAGSPLLSALGLDQPSGNMEGKELRFGSMGSALWASLTTASSNGSTNAALDSFTPLGGMVPLIFMQLGEVVFGGVGSGLYGLLVYTLLAVFIAGLMIGRTPEYLGKKIGVFEIQMASLVILIPALATLVATALTVGTPSSLGGEAHPGAQGFTQILYAFTSASNNNGSSFAGLNMNTPFANCALALCMLAGRFGLIFPVLAIAGELAQKTAPPANKGSLDTTSLLFVMIVASVVLLIGFLTFVPTLLLGPIAEHMHLMAEAAR